jgi:ribose/xylose/arabinose/galactoside ABC-type transport system permease subunit
LAARPIAFALPAFVAAVAGIFGVLAPGMLSAGNIEDLMSGYSFVAILAIGQAFPIMLRGVDLSAGAIVALAGMVCFDLSLMFHVHGAVVIALSLMTAMLAGVVNGLLIVGLRLQPFVATLATLGAYRGLVFAISGRQIVPALSTTPIGDPWITGLETYVDIGAALRVPERVHLPAFPLSFFVMTGVLVFFQVMLRRTRLGRDLHAVGGNPEAARLAGIRTRRITVVAYAISGLCAGIAALLLVARLTTATEALGSGMELTAIAAAVMGGVSLSGGTGSAIGPALAAFLLGIVLIGLTLMGISQFVQQILTGVILLGAISNDRLQAMRRSAPAAPTWIRKISWWTRPAR